VGHGRGDPGRGSVSVPVPREWRLNRDRGLFTALPSPEEAATHVLSETEQASLDRLRARSFQGTPDVVAGRLNALAAEHGVEEIAVLTTLHDPEARRRSYTLLANEMMS
jgi:alkanesulfonate monooxygenase SsuD/methylene tetrahydromethanopterin reductase-like flavin-dependent oxidoreductase (luciferase family)